VSTVCVPIERLTGPDDPRVAGYRDVPEPELVRARGLFIAEGRLVVRRLIQDGRFVLRSVLVNDRAYESLRPDLDAIAALVAIYVCRSGDFPEITGFNIHRGCLALVERPPERAVEPLVASARRIVVLEGVANADNVGGVFRNAAAFGADAVLLSPTSCDPLYRKAIRTSMAATLRLPFARVEPWPDRLQQLKTNGFTIAALTPREPAIDLEVFANPPHPPKLALLVGTEGEGLTPAAEARADVRVRIPVAPEIDSLNLAVAVGIALYRLSR
jgi:tRNA G18 (ribose-2'-O)-methylase SpoU